MILECCHPPRNYSFSSPNNWKRRILESRVDDSIDLLDWEASTAQRGNERCKLAATQERIVEWTPGGDKMHGILGKVHQHACISPSMIALES